MWAWDTSGNVDCTLMKRRSTINKQNSPSIYFDKAVGNELFVSQNHLLVGDQLKDGLITDHNITIVGCTRDGRTLAFFHNLRDKILNPTLLTKLMTTGD